MSRQHVCVPRQHVCRGWNVCQGSTCVEAARVSRQHVCMPRQHVCRGGNVCQGSTCVEAACLSRQHVCQGSTFRVQERFALLATTVFRGHKRYLSFHGSLAQKRFALPLRLFSKATPAI
ncbi:hypothetical protein E2C01_031099 [Portunus trituberculatus]|uniref:Uncharacterized protein n=1 Tax=Portunus trituberculatus TaxID=210409 RepID=A0A5B7ETK1_PORTR|nr:hypothetical protein [Portunus trituberculatus]